MKKKPDNLVYVIALALLIVGGIVTTTIINAIKNNQAGTDIRAKAGVTSTLKLTGVISAVNDTDGTLTVNDVQFSEESRSGKAVNYGVWTVTPPVTFPLGSAIPGTTVTFTINTDAFDVASKQVVASQMNVTR